VPRQRERRIARSQVGAIVAAILALVIAWWPVRLLVVDTATATPRAITAALVLTTALIILVLAAVLDSTRRRWWLWATVVLVGLLLVALTVWRVPQLLYTYAEPKDRAAAEASTRTGILAGLAGAAALLGLTYTARTYRVTERGHITDRYAKAIEQLGSSSLDVRLGGIYALEQIATDTTNDRDRSTVTEVLSAFVRVHSDPLYGMILGDISSEQRDELRAHYGGLQRQPPDDVQAAATVLGRLPRARGSLRGPDLSRAWLVGADLQGSNLAGSRLREARLMNANLGDADLSGADLSRSDLSRAGLFDADVSDAHLIGATLIQAHFGGADLRRADFSSADMTKADLNGAQLSGAKFPRAKLNSTFLIGADLREALLIVQEQVNEAIGDNYVLLPSNLKQPANWPER
jgi:hypothetical protein